MTHLNDLSKAYLEQIAEKKKDDTYLEPDMKKRQANNEKARKELAKGPQMKNPHFEEKQLDPVGKEDGDVNNDGKKDSTDSYLMKRRKAIAKAMKKESFATSDWRHEISEVMTDIESQPIKEKKVKNKVTINPNMSEAVEEIGGTLIEEIEVDDIEDVIECVYGELIEEGYSEDEVETAIEQALTEATVTMGHDTEGPKAERTRDKLKKKAKGFLGKVAVKAYNKAREAKAAATPAVQRAKTSAKRGIRKMAQKVVDRMSEEVIDEAVYGYGSAKKPAPTDKRLTVTNADKAGNTPAYQKYKAGDKNYKAADHMKEGIRDVDPEKGTAERKARLEKKRGMKMDDHPQYQKEGYGAPGHNPGSGEKSVARAKALMDKQGRKGAPGLDAMAAAKKEHEARRGVKKEEVEVAEADSLAAMQARREKRLAAQRKREGTTASGRDFGHDYSLSDKQQKARRDAEFKAGMKKEEVESVDEVYKGKHGQTDKQYADSRSQGGKMVSGDSKMSGAEYTHGRRVKAANPGMQPDVGGKTKPKSQGKMDSGTRADMQYRKANLRKEDAAMSPQEIQLQRRKAQIDKMIAQKRQQALSKAKSSEAPAKAMGEATYPQDFKGGPVAKKKVGGPKQHDQEMSGGRRKTVDESAEDRLRDRRMERGGVDGNVDYSRPPAAPNLAGKKKPNKGGPSAIDIVKSQIRAKYGDKAIMDTKKKKD